MINLFLYNIIILMLAGAGLALFGREDKSKKYTIHFGAIKRRPVPHSDGDDKPFSHEKAEELKSLVENWEKSEAARQVLGRLWDVDDAESGRRFERLRKESRKNSVHNRKTKITHLEFDTPEEANLAFDALRDVEAFETLMLFHGNLLDRATN